MDLKRYLLPVVISLSIYASNAGANDGIWTDEPAALQLKSGTSSLSKQRYLRADISKLKDVMFAAPLERTYADSATIELPLPNGEMHNFFIEESPIMAPGLAAQYPDFKTYRVRSASNAAITGRLDISATRFHGYLTTDKGVVFIDPDRNAEAYYRSFYKHDYVSAGPKQFSCGVDALSQSQEQAQKFANYQQKISARIDNELLTYEIAVGATFEYSETVAANDVDNTQIEIATAINRVNNIYERDLGITLVLITDNSDLISTTQGELSNDDGIALLFETEDYIETTKGVLPADYDLGHIFSTGAGGVAGLGVVCNDVSPVLPTDLLHKSQGVTGLPDPTGDAYYIDYVAHELGHQFGANHTFNATTASCGGGNRNATTAYEPGSGTTIMAYAGICGSEDVQTTAVSTTTTGISEDVFHAGSIAEIIDFSRVGGGSACADVTAPGNAAPTADAGANFSIPGLTPFELTGNETNGDPDTLSYQWDEMDIGTATNSATFGSDLGDNPLFRSFAPSTSPVRTLPRMETIVSGVDDKAERLPSLSRTMNFRLTVRDNMNNLDEDDMQVVVDETKGPFTVYTGATAITLDTTQDQVIEWNAACTEQAPVNCANVDILLSTDSGVTFSSLTTTANDGEALVTLPDTPSTTAVIKIACSDNIFFDTSDNLITLQQGTGDVLVSTGIGGSDNCGTATTATDGGGTLTTTTAPTFDISNAIPVDLSNVISDTVNDLSNDTDVFQFTGTDEVYTIVLSDFGNSDLDLYLTDANGVVVVQSIGTDITETIKVTLVEGTTYYLVVTAFDTGWLESILQGYNNIQYEACRKFRR